MPEELPSGLVTFAFVDVVGSTRAFAEHGDDFVAALALVQREIAESTTRHGGVVVKTEGDGAFLAFPTADGGARALVDIQRAIDSWVEGPAPRLRVRAGLHTGWAQPVAGDYIALAVNVAARVCSAARAGQVLASAPLVDAFTDELRAAAGQPVGEFTLKDVAGPSPLWRLHGDDVPPAAPPFVRTNVAEPRSSFVGRHTELTALRELLESHRLVSVVAPGGMGKTRLVSELLLAEQHRYGGGAWLVELAGVAEPDEVVRQAADLIPGAATARTVEELEGLLASRVEDARGLLVVLDNCEHVLDAAADLAAALSGAGVRVLTTSREALRVANEVVWRLPPLTDGERLRELFLERAATAGGVVDAADPAVALLCRRLDGMPLAIELAAGQAVDVPPATLLKLLDAGEETLARRGGGRQSSLDALVAWSLDRIAADRRDAMLALSLPSGRLEADWAGDLVSRVLDPSGAGDGPDLVLRDLVRASLIDLDGGQYRLLDTIRAAARRRLHANPEMLARARAAFHGLAADLAEPYCTGRDRIGSEATVEMLNLWQDALIDAGRDLRPGLGRVWMACSMGRAARSGASEQQLETAETTLRGAEVGDALDIDQARTLVGALNFLTYHRRPIPVEASELDRWVALSAELPPRVRWAVVLGVAYATEDQVRRMRLADQLEEIAEITGHPYDRAILWQLRSATHQAMGDLAAALAAAEHAARIDPADALGDLAILQANVAELLVDLDRPNEALRWLHRILGDRPSEIYRWVTLLQLARAHQALGQTTATRAALAELEDELGPPDQATGLKGIVWEDLRKSFPVRPG